MDGFHPENVGHLALRQFGLRPCTPRGITTLLGWTDRAVRGQVVDYLDFHLGGRHWPAFNIADMAITAGAAALIAASFLGQGSAKPSSSNDV